MVCIRVLGLFERDVRGALENVIGDLDAVAQMRILCGDLRSHLGLAVVERQQLCMNFTRGLAAAAISSLLTWNGSNSSMRRPQVSTGSPIDTQTSCR